MRILLNCYSNSTTDIKLKLLIFYRLEKGIPEDWVFREFCTPKYRILSMKTLAGLPFLAPVQREPAAHIPVRTQNGASAEALGNHQQLDSAAPSLLHLSVPDAQLASDQDLAKHVAIKKEVVAWFLEARNSLRPTLDQSPQHHA
jgi:hypothetical protein